MALPNDIVDLMALGADIYVESGAVNGSDLRLTLTDGRVIVVDMRGLTLPDEHLVNASLNAADILTLTMKLGAPIMVDLSNVGKDTYVESGSVTGNTLTLLIGDGTGPTTPVSIDVSALATDNFLLNTNLDALTGILRLTMNNGTIHSIDVGAYTKSIDKHLVASNFDCATNEIVLILTDLTEVRVDMTCFLASFKAMERGGVAYDASKTYINGDIVGHSGKAWINMTGGSGVPGTSADWVEVNAVERGGVSWVGTTAYLRGDIVSLDNIIYIAQNANTNISPLLVTGDWRDYSSVWHTSTVNPTFNPTGDNYPTIAGETVGAISTVTGLGAGNTFTYTAGPLSGTIVKDGDTVTWTNGPETAPIWLHTPKVEISVERGGVLWSSAIAYLSGDTVTDTANGELYKTPAGSAMNPLTPSLNLGEWTKVIVDERAGMAWRNNQTYLVDDIAVNGDKTWIAVAPVNGSAPGAVVGEWKLLSSDILFDDLKDIDMGTNPPNNGDIIHWDGTKWVPVKVTAERAGMDWRIAETYLADDIVRDGNKTWVGIAPVVGSAPSAAVAGEWKLITADMKISDIGDVDGTPPNNGDHLVWDGTKWVPVPQGVERGGLLWSATTAYSIGDVVSTAGKLFLALTATTGTNPVGNPTDWILVGTERGGLAHDAIVNYKAGDTATEKFAGTEILYIAKVDNDGILPSADPLTWEPVISATKYKEKGGVEWDTSTAYNPGDIAVEFAGAKPVSYVARVGNIGQPPSLNLTTIWELVVPIEIGGRDWKVTLQYLTGDIVTESNIVYKAITNSIGNNPTITPTEWQEVDKAGALWKNITSYVVGDIITHLDIVYTALLPSLGTVPVGNALTWRIVGGAGLHNDSRPYFEGDIVSVGGDLYIAPVGGIPAGPFDPSQWIATTKGGTLWVTNHNYEIGDVATFGGAAYVSLTDNISQQPDLNPADWRLDKHITAVAGDITGVGAIEGVASYWWDGTNDILDIRTN